MDKISLYEEKMSEPEPPAEYMTVKELVEYFNIEKSRVEAFRKFLSRQRGKNAMNTFYEEVERLRPRAHRYRYRVKEVEKNCKQN